MNIKFGNLEFNLTEFNSLSEGGLIKFKEILRVIERYSEAMTGRKNEFRQRVILDNSAKVYVKDYGLHHYRIIAMVGNDADTWVQLDGIAEEKIQYKDNPKHPVHKITGLGEIMDEEKLLSKVA